MSTTTPSIGRQVLATVKRCTVIVGVLAGLAFGYQAGITEGATEAPAARAIPTVQDVTPQEDDPAFDCRIHGNQVCGPTGEFEAGCYNAGVLVVPWSEALRALDASPCSDITGTYDVPGGSLTVFEDTTARYTPSA